VPLPQLQALDVERQHGTIVVQVDPLYDVRPVQLSGCEWTAGAVAAPWLDSAQRPLARLALHYETPAYGGTLNLQTRAPVVTCTTITNVRVTDRLMEETILLDFDIATAGVRSVVFLLPRRMQDARVEAPLLRLKTLEPVERDGGDFLRVRLDLQDAVTGQLRVLIHQDLALVHEPQAAPIPIVETGSTAQRYVVLENSGRGELIVESPAGFEELGRQQQAWRTLAEILGSQPTQAFVAGAQAAASGLTYHVKQRTAVQTAGARIGLAETWLVVDDSGAYRGVQDYHVDNTTEQFLEIQLPDGAALWSVRAADVMVKPVDGAAGSAAGLVRIPLVKTAAGDLDYLVRLTYAGRLAAPGGLRNTEFPLLHTVNINVELSQVRLLLPETCAWMNFGGTMRRVDEEGDLAAGYLGYQTKQAQRLTGTLQSAEEFSQVRALANLKLLESELLRYQHSAAVYAGNDAFRMNSAENAAALDEARRQYQAAEERLHGKADGDNRQALGRHFVVQSISRAGEAVNELEFNFTDQISIPERDQAEGGGFDQGWFEDNDLTEALGVTTVGGLDAASDGPAAGAAEKPRLFQLQKTKAPDAPATPQMIQQMDQQAQAGRGKEAVRGGSDDKKTVARYKAALEQEAGAAGAGPPAADDEAALREEGLVAGGRYDRAGFGGSLVSLDVEIPRRGREYLFTTPRGDARIHSRAVSHRTIEILGRVGLLALAAALTWGVVRSTRGLLAGTAAARRASAVLIALGGLSVIAGILPLAGLAAVVAGIALRRRALAGGGSAWLRQVTS
jgi:hypothetical protein